ncbi:MAG: plasmid maintenance system antidote protein VapI [Phenylobacterium sp.]|jgi:plasmid maintenance system antidote protein VapI
MEETVSIESVMPVTRPPKGASGYMAQYFKSKNISANQAAKKLAVSQPTVSRFINGGSLTPNMAAKIEMAFGIGVETLFNLEAQANAYRAKQLMRG